MAAIRATRKNVSLDEYVKKECALTVDFKDRMAHLTHDFATNAKNQEALADTVQSIADLYDELLVKTKELGDSPNGEGKDDSGEVEQSREVARRHTRQGRHRHPRRQERRRSTSRDQSHERRDREVDDDG